MSQLVTGSERTYVQPVSLPFACDAQTAHQAADGAKLSLAAFESLLMSRCSSGGQTDGCTTCL